ncbi:MAG: hypothetical protein OIF48_00705 [Silicimonas sp.]|nr:hypothetical protein [Silicimonas sp.]
MAVTTFQHIIGIDGGGSGARVAIAERDGKVVGKGTSGPANATSDLDGAIANIREALAQAADEAALPDPVIAAACAHAGIAGAISETEQTKIAEALPMKTTVTEDKQTALKGALGDRDGILLSIGTGSLIGARRKRKIRFLGGYGLPVSDQASGAWLGRMLLTETLLCHDGLAPPTALTRRIMDEFDNDAASIASFAAQASPAEFARFAPQITEAADDGDPIAMNLVQGGSIYLTQAIDSLGLGRGDVLCLAGGLGPAYAPWLMPSHRRHLADPAGTALDGALALARKAAR